MRKGDGFCEFCLQSLLMRKVVVPFRFADKAAELPLMPATEAPWFIVHNGLTTISVSGRCGWCLCQFYESHRAPESM